jgi:hypothetical protein
VEYGAGREKWRRGIKPMKIKARKIRFKRWFHEKYIEWYVRNELNGAWRNSSGCWNGNYIKLWYREDEDTTYLHFPGDPCYTWKGDVVESVLRDVKSLTRRLK